MVSKVERYPASSFCKAKELVPNRELDDANHGNFRAPHAGHRRLPLHRDGYGQRQALSLSSYRLFHQFTKAK
jgi:hypothetical protein